MSAAVAGLSPTESKSATSEKNSDPTDTHSEASSSPHGGSSEGAEDLSLPKAKEQPQAWTESDSLEVKCGECGCLFETQDMLKIHVQETHMFGGGDPAQFLGNHPMMGGGTNTGGQESDAIASLLALHAKNEAPEAGETKGDKVFNPEAYCQLCNKEFCNKYYLNSHRATKHGIVEALPHSRSGSFSHQPDQFLAAKQAAMAVMASGGGRKEREPKCRLPTVPDQEEERCPYCPSRFSLGGGLQEHILTVHAPFNPAAMQQSLAALYAAQLGNPFAQLLHAPLDKKGFGEPSQASQMSFSPSAMTLAAMGLGSNTLTPEQLALFDATAQGAPGSTVMGKREDMEAYLAMLGGVPDATQLPASFPGLVGTQSPGQGNANGGVINPEAYCEMCRKEFCNKYFLRTHKQKKHGIQPTEDSPGSLKRPRAPEASPETRLPPTSAAADFHHPSVIQSLFGQEPALKRPSVDRDATPPATNAGAAIKTEQEDFPCTLCAKSFNQYIGLVTHQYQEHGQLAALMPGTQSGLFSQATPTKDPEAFCELCQKEFCSPFFLRQHRVNVHGMPDATPTPPPTASPPKRHPSFSGGAFAFPPAGFGSESPFSAPSMSGMPTMVGGGGLLGTPTSGGKSRYSTGKNFCDICNKEVCNKYFLRTHMLKMHGIVIDEHKTVIGNINTLDKEKTGTLIFRCDLCAKELRSRELLREHKQDSHGVLPRSVPPPTTPVQQDKASLQGQLSSSSGGGLEADAAVCPFCAARAGSTKALQVHLLKACPQRALLSRKEEEEANSSPSLSQTSDLSTGPSGQNSDTGLNPLTIDEGGEAKCDFCDARFGDLLQRQLHIIGSHAAQIRGIADHAALMSLMSGNIPQSFTESTASEATSPKQESSGTPTQAGVDEAMKVYRCRDCPYATKWASNLSAHRKRHARLGAAEGDDKPFACSVCLRQYRYAHTLAKHAECHRLALANPDLSQKYGCSPQKEPEVIGRRFRCTKCQKLFKSREQCRAHLFAAHRRSPAKASPADKESTVTAAALVSGLVEELHAEKAGRDLSEALGLSAFAEPLPQDGGKPYTVQMFRVEASLDSPSALFAHMNLYLPVRKHVDGPLRLALSLTPLPAAESAIKTL